MEDDIFGQFGYIKLETITKTLQGNILNDLILTSIPINSINSYQCISNGLILTTFTKYENFFDDANNYYLAMKNDCSDLSPLDRIIGDDLNILDWCSRNDDWCFWNYFSDWLVLIGVVRAFSDTTILSI